jgi:hypothetical protein
MRAGVVVLAAALVLGGCGGRVPDSRPLPAAPVATPAVPPPASRSAIAAASPAPAGTAAVPVVERVPFLKGQTHVHTSGSYDAKAPPGAVLAFYAARGYDFVAITDHNRVTVVAPPDGLLLVPGVELTQNAATCEPAPPPSYRCLFHTSALFVDPARDRARGAHFTMPFRPERVTAYAEQMAFAAELGGIAVINHPHFHFAANADTIAALARRGLRLLELSNAALDNQSPDGRDAAERRSERLWDDVLGRGLRVFALATDDAHHFPGDGVKRLEKARYSGDRGFVMVRAKKSLEAIRTALIEGDFYATTGVLLRELEATPHALRVVVEAGAGDNFAIRFVGRGSRVLAEQQGPEASYAPRGDEGYVRAVVQAPGGQKAWTQPVFVGS